MENQLETNDVLRVSIAEALEMLLEDDLECGDLEYLKQILLTGHTGYYNYSPEDIKRELSLRFSYDDIILSDE